MKVNRSFFLSMLMITSMILAACGGGGTGQSTSQPTSAGSGAAGITPAATTAGGGTTTTPAATTAATTAAGGTTTTPAATTAATTAAGGTTTPAATTAAGTGGTTGANVGSATLTMPSECSANVALTYWNPFTGPDGPFMGQLVDAFNAAHPNIKVTMNSQADYYTQLTTAAASDSLPDVAIVHADQVATEVFRNILRPIDPLVTTIGVSDKDFPAAVWAAGEVAGKRYSIPLDIHPMTMYYNADLLQKANIANPPKTKDEFEAAAKATTAGDTNGFMITNGFPVQQIFQMLLHQFGGTEFSEDGTKVTWNSDAGVQALNWMVQAQKNYSQPNLEVDADLNAFKSGSVGMIWNGIWQLTNVTGSSVDFKGMATSVPQIGTKMAVWAGSHQLTLPVHKKGEDKCKDAAAGIFIQYVLSNSITWSKAGQIPASNAVRASDEFKNLHPQAEIGASVENAFFPPSLPGINDALAPLGEAIGSVMSGQSTDVKKALDDSAKRGEQILQQNAANYGKTPK